MGNSIGSIGAGGLSGNRTGALNRSDAFNQTDAPAAADSLPSRSVSVGEVMTVALCGLFVGRALWRMVRHDLPGFRDGMRMVGDDVQQLWVRGDFDAPDTDSEGEADSSGDSDDD